MRRRVWLLALIAAASSTTPAGAGGGSHRAANFKWEDGSRAPMDAWTQDDGCPARTGATESMPRDGPREVAWKLSVSGEVEGEPLAWGGRTFVVEKAGTKRTVHVLVTATGVERYRQSFDTVLPPAPCVYDGRLVMRTSPRAVQGFSVGETSLGSRWTLTAKTAIGPPTVLRDQVYVVVDGVLQRRTFGSPQPDWPKAGGSGPVRVEGSAAAKGTPTDYPRPSVRGDLVYVTSGHKLVEIDRISGAIRRQVELPSSLDPRTSRVLVGDGDVLLPTGKHEPGAEGDADTWRYARPPSGSLTKRESVGLPFGVASIGTDWVGLLAAGGSGTTLVRLSGRSDDAERPFEIASPTLHAEFLEARTPPTASGFLVFLGGRVFDAVSLEVLRQDAMPGISRPIVLRDRILVVEARNKVTAWKSARKTVDAPPLRLLATDGEAPPPVPAARAVLEDGRIVAGGFVLDKKTAALRGTGKPGDAGSWPLTSVRALLTDESPRRLLLASRPEDAALGVAAIARAGEAPDLLALVPKALESQSAELARRILTAAAERAAPEADLARLERDVEALESKGGVEPDEKASDVEASLKAVLLREADALVEAAALPDGVPFAYPLALLRATLDRSPYHSGAGAWIKAHLPPGLAPTVIKSPSDWLDFLEIRAATSLRVYGAATPGKDAPAADGGSKSSEDPPQATAEALATARASWRPDLVGFQNGPLLVVAPPDRPGVIARSLTIGRIVCDALDLAFASIGPRRAEDEILVLYLFPSQGEYLNQSVGNKGGDEPDHGFGGLESTAGHYDPRANVTRIFVPGYDVSDTVPGTYAHELTHHWISRRRPPRPGDDAGGLGSGGPGYFVVEGFADFVRGFAFDVEGVRAEPKNPKAEYADVVAALPDARCVPWTKIFTMPQSEAYALIGKGDIDVPQRWRLGPGERLSSGLLYYAQSAAATAYLFLADDGKYRPALLAYLYGYYSGNGDPQALLRSLGCSADELGARVVRWCRSVVGLSK